MFVDFLVPVDAWRAQPIDVARWMAAQALRGVNPMTIERRSAALNYFYEKHGKGGAQGRPGVGIRRSPVRDVVVQKTLKGIFRKHGRPANRKMPIMLDTLERMMDQQPDQLCGLRNRVMLIVGWSAALRITELSMLDASPRRATGDGWIEISDEGIIVNLRRSKRNQQKKELERYPVPARPTRARALPRSTIAGMAKSFRHQERPAVSVCRTRVQAASRAPEPSLYPFHGEALGRTPRHRPTVGVRA